MIGNSLEIITELFFRIIVHGGLFLTLVCVKLLFFGDCMK